MKLLNKKARYNIRLCIFNSLFMITDIQYIRLYDELNLLIAYQSLSYSRFASWLSILSIIISNWLFIRLFSSIASFHSWIARFIISINITFFSELGTETTSSIVYCNQLTINISPAVHLTFNWNGICFCLLIPIIGIY